MSSSSFVDDPDTSEVDLGVTRDGLTQLRRRWLPPSPRAAVLIVHGIGEHSGRYRHVGAQMADAGLAVVAYDQRGFGQSGGRRAHVDAWSEYHDDVEDHLGELATLSCPVVLLGHSMGGLISLGYVLSGARPQPDLLVLSAPAIGVDAPGWMRALSRPMAMVLPRLRMKNPIALEALSRDPAVQQAYDTDPLVERGATTQLGAELFAEIARVNRHLGDLHLPTLVIHGGQDRLVPTASSAPLVGRPGVTRVVHPDLRHECFNEPEGPEVIAALIAWIDNQLDVLAG